MPSVIFPTVEEISLSLAPFSVVFTVTVVASFVEVSSPAISVYGFTDSVGAGLSGTALVGVPNTELASGDVISSLASTSFDDPS